MRNTNYSIMSDVSDDEEGRQDENLVVSDDEDPYIQGNFKHRIHSTKIVTDTSASIFVQENRYDRHGLTPNGNIDKLFDHVSITNASAIRYCPSYQDAKHHKSRDEPDPFTSRYHHSLNKFQEYVEGTLPLSYLAERLGVPFDDVVDFFSYTPRVLDFRMLGGTASEYFHPISEEEYQAFDAATQEYWDNTVRFKLYILGNHPRDICVFVRGMLV